MKSLIKTLLLVLFLASFASVNSQPQDDYINRPSAGMGRGTFGSAGVPYRIYSFADSTDRQQNHVEFHFALINDMLTFIKQSENWYRAKYDLSVVLYNKMKEAVAFQNIQDTVAVTTFAATNSRQRPMLKRMVFTLPPDDYEYKIELLDAETEKNLGRPMPLKLINYSQPSLQISDLVITSRQNCSAKLRDFIPNLRESFSDPQADVGAYFELYGSTPRDSITVHYTLLSVSGQRIDDHRYRIPGGSLLPQCLSFKDKISRPGEYTLEVVATAGRVQVRSERKLFIHWGNVPKGSSNVDVAVEQLAMIVQGSSIQKMRNAAAEERQKLMDEFWRQRDPTPGTEENELRDEFFSRIDFADQNFRVPAVGLEGWKSDRGRVLLRNGHPDNIERQAIEPGMPAVEFWTYTRLNKRFIFADRQGLGDFRLVKVE